ncbi:MAG: magnesium and cobalt transport protein CorA, partial [Deltaproteobacteria bacterium]|nr:magnesium and cobalt transport protein CorA [Deltaproteobacteria bacterium]
PRTVQALHRWRHGILMLRRAAWPLRDVASALSRGGNPRIPETVEPFLRDLHDHTLLVVDTLEGIREVITGLLDLHVTLVSHRLNEVMRLLTVIATIFIPLTFLAGVWGMNFRHMPELGWTWAYPWGFWGVILAVGGGMVWFFRRKRWF